MGMDNVYLQKLVEDPGLPSDRVHLSRKLFIKHGFYNSIIGTELKLGSLSLSISIFPGDTEGVISVSTSIMKQLDLPDSIKLNISIGDNKIRLGPLLGMFAKENTLEQLRYKLFVSKLKNYCQQEGIILIYFSHKEIDLQKMRINAFIYNFKNKVWENRFLPFPDVLYNTGIKSFPNDQRAKIERLLPVLERLGIKKINSQHDFDKWETYCKFQKIPEITPYLPKTVLYNNISDLDLMLNKYDTVFAKGCRGNNGREVIKIIKINHHYNYSFINFNKLIRGKASCLAELEERLLNIFGRKTFILQQGIDVINANENAADIRVLLQKDINNNWNITNMALRIAAKHMPVTSTVTGANAYRIEEGLLKCGLNDTEIKIIKTKCWDFLYLFLKALEKEFGSFGETGVDLAIDRNFKLWFIECNANPAKTVAMLTGTKEEKKLSLLYPLLYAKFLAGF